MMYTYRVSRLEEPYQYIVVYLLLGMYTMSYGWSMLYICGWTILVDCIGIRDKVSRHLVLGHRRDPDSNNSAYTYG